MKVLQAVSGAISDVFSKELRGIALLCAVLAALLLAAAAWAVITFVVPLIPNGAGWLSYVSSAGEIAGGALTVAAAIVLWPAVSMVIGGVLFDVAAERIEKARFPADPPGRLMAPHEGLLNGVRIAIPALLLNLLTLPLIFIPVVNLIVFLTLNATLMGREYFSLAALRHRPWKEARALRKKNGAVIFLAGLTCAALLLIPVLNFLAPIYGAALMTRLHKALA